MQVINYKFKIESGTSYKDVPDVNIADSEISEFRFGDVVKNNLTDMSSCDNGWIVRVPVDISDEYRAAKIYGIYMAGGKSFDMLGGYDVFGVFEDGKYRFKSKRKEHNHSHLHTEEDGTIIYNEPEEYFYIPLVYKRNSDNSPSVYKIFEFSKKQRPYSYSGNNNWLQDDGTFETSGHDDNEDVDIIINLSGPISPGLASQYKSAHNESVYSDAANGVFNGTSKAALLSESETVMLSGNKGYTRLFPITQSVAVFDKSGNQIDKSIISINRHSGEISILGTDKHDEVKVFYGVVPVIRVCSGAEYQLSDISVHKDVVLLEPQISPAGQRYSQSPDGGKIKVSQDFDQKSFILNAPQKYAGISVAIDGALSINGNMTPAGGTSYIPNTMPSKLDISQPNDIINLLRPIKSLGNGKYELPGFINSELVSVYARFKYSDGIERITHVSMNKKDTGKRSVSIGYGVGGYGQGAYGGIEKQILSGSTSVLSDTDPDAADIDNEKISLRISSKKSGRNVILPAIPDIPSIRVTQISLGTTKEFTNYTVISPDILVINDESDAEYFIEFTPIINPILTSIRTSGGIISNKTLDKISSTQGFIEMYAIYSHKVNCYIGGIDKFGDTEPLGKIEIDIEIDKDTVVGITSNFKNIAIG